jgi:tetratricopeptide (TPR) repeat protein
MFEAVGNLSGVVAYSAFDIADYDAADRCFQFALWCADQSKCWPLRANTLAEMARKETYLGNLDNALTLIELAQVRADRVSATARAMLWTVHARLFSLTGRHDDARVAVDRADAHFANRDLTNDPPWLAYYDKAEHQGSTGKALIPVAKEMNRPELAAPRLKSAIQLHDTNYPRSRTFSRARLAALMMAVGDPYEAVSIGRQAVADAARLRSKRIIAELSSLARSSERHARIGEVAELRHDITALALPRA